MNEKEKMQAGMLYQPMDETLLSDRERAKHLCWEYNKADPSDLCFRKKTIQELLNCSLENFLIEQPFQCDYGYNISIGKNFYSNHNLIILDPAKVEFGDNVLIGPNCAFYTPEHPLDFETRNQGLEYAKPIKVGNNVWFGGSVTVLGGVIIGDNSVIGAGSVVVHDIPANSIAVGNPCKVIKKI